MSEKQKILVVDDEPEIREVLRVMLSGEGYEVTEACDAHEALERAPEADLVILDILMPGESGIWACERIRERTNVPILFLTAKSGEHDKVQGFSAGGDDYLVKPFSYTELLTRVGALLRHYQVYKGQQEKPEKLAFYRDITVDRRRQSVFVGEERIALTEMEYQILLLLVSSPGKVFSVREIYEAVWKETFYASSGNTVMVHIRNIHRKLGKERENYIQNVWGRGYCVV
ncbi:MAG: response regulator transcription factor [Lachnospiraceae bacterium]|nr:response regulator transcription factor [Lachnospiraceae bacterium]